MNLIKVLGLAVGASLMWGYGASAEAAPIPISQSAGISNSDVVILAGDKGTIADFW